MIPVRLEQLEQLDRRVRKDRLDPLASPDRLVPREQPGQRV